MDNFSSESILLSSINMANFALHAPNVCKVKMLKIYDDIASEILGINNNIVANNMIVYKVLLNKTLFITTIQNTKVVELLEYKNLKSLIDSIKRNNITDSGKLYNILYRDVLNHFKNLGGEVNISQDVDSIQNALNVFGIQEATNLEETDLDINNSLSPDEEIPDVIFDEDPEDLEEEPEEATEEELEALEEEIDIDDPDEEPEDPEDEIEISEVDDEEENAKHLKDGKISGTANDLDNDYVSDVPDEEIEPVVDNIISNIINVYEQMFKPLFLNPPLGVLYSNNGVCDIMSIGKTSDDDSDDKDCVKVHGIPRIKFFCNYIYTAILNELNFIREAPKVGDDGMSIKSAWINSDGTMLYNYAPHIQVRNSVGVFRNKDTGKLQRARDWMQFKNKFTSDVKPTILAMLKRVNIRDGAILKTAMESIQELYTTIILVNEFDNKKAMRLTVFSQTGSLTKRTGNIAKAIINKNPLSKPLDEYKVMNDSEVNGVRTILIVTDMNRYKGELMWGYKLIGKTLNAGGVINLKNTLVGTTLKGDAYTVNLADTASTIISIIAGTGSGKGVLTLALAASILGANSPLVYVDYKPDMAKALWENQRKNNGIGILAVDGTGATRTSSLEAGAGLSSELEAMTVGLLNNIAYVKAIQLMTLTAQYRVDNYDKRKMFFILDEAQIAGKSIMESTKGLFEKAKALKPKKDSSEEQIKQYNTLIKLYNLYNSTKSSLDTFQKTFGRSGNTSAILLGQDALASAWPNIFYNCMASCPLKFLGSGTWSSTGSTKAGMAKDVEGAELLGRGYFGVCKGANSSKENTTVIKTAMVLNDADFNANTMEGGIYTGSLLSNIDESLKDRVIEEDLVVSNENIELASKIGCDFGQTNELVGFPGLIKLIGSLQPNFNMNDALTSGEKYLKAVLTKLGIMGENGTFDSVEEYLYSAREDSVFEFGQLSMALKKGITIYDYINGDYENSKPVDLPDEPYEEIGFTGGTDNNSTNNSEKDNYLDLEPDLSNKETDKLNNELKNLKKVGDISKLLTLNVLKNKNFSDDDIVRYESKHNIEKYIRRNIFDYTYDGNDYSKKGTKLAILYIENYIYICERLNKDINETKSYIVNIIESGNDSNNKYKVLIGLIEAIQSGLVSINKLPDNNMKKQWILKYLSQNKPDINKQPEVNMNLNVNNNNETTSSDNLASKIFKLSSIVAKGRNWTSDDLLAFQMKALESMGVHIHE